MSTSLYIVRPTMGVGGADRVTLTLLRELPRDRFNPTLVLMRDEGPLRSAVPPDVPVRSLERQTLWSAWIPLVKLVRREQPEILFSTSGGTNMVAALAHLLAGRKGRLVLSERGALRSGLSWKKKLQRWLKRVLYPQADCVTAVSQGIKEELIQQLHLPPESISVVYNPIVDAHLEAEAREPVRHPWFGDRQQEESPVLLAVGRLVPEKDHATLLTAFAELRRSHEARLVILGEGPLRGELERLAKSLGVSETVSMPGFVANPFKYMARCQVFILSSRFEGLPGALIQAMACGAPVISTDCRFGPSEILESPGCGVLVPVGNPSHLAGELRRLLDDPEARSRIAAAGRLAAQRFSVESIINNYVQALV